MSRSIKISTIDQAESRINHQDSQLRNLGYRLDTIADEAKREAEHIAEERVNALRNDINSMEDSINSHIQGLESEMAEMDRNHCEALNRQANEFYKNLNQLHEWTSDSFAKQQKQISNVRQSVNQLYQKEANDKKKSELMLKDLKILVIAVGKRNNHDKYAPGDWNKLNRRVDTLSSSQIPPAAIIAEAMNITNDLWDLEEDIQKRQLLFEAMHNIVLREATELLQTMNKNRNAVCFTDEEGKNLKDENGNDIIVEIDFWTKGEYGKLEEIGRELKLELETQKERPELTEERLKQILTTLGEIKAKQNDLVKLALKRGVASEERVKISEDIINAMLQQGFELKTMNNGTLAHNYLGGETESDQREGVFALLKNGNGTEISVIIHPDDTLTKNHIVFQRNDDSSLNENELRRSIEEVKTIIENQGYKMGNIGSPMGTGDNSQYELADANALASVGINQNLKRRLGFNTEQKIQ